jgi:hypothetical protein
MTMALPRPSQKRLEKLLTSNPARFEKYLTRYPEIAEQFELNNPLAGITDSARRVFDSAIDIPNDLAARLRSRIAESQSETTSFAVLMDLAGVGVATLRLLADDEPLEKSPN